MRSFFEVIRRLTMLARGRRFDEDLREEMELHMELRRQQHIGQGMPPGEAKAAAQRRFGNVMLMREQSRDGWGWAWIEQSAQDVRYGVRSMMRNPGFTLVAVMILAMGAGASTAVFSVVNSVLLHPLSYAEPRRLVTLLHGGAAPVSAANYVDWRDQTDAFAAVGAAEYWSPNLTGIDAPENIRALRLTQNLLPMLGVEPMIGRVFAVGEDQAGAERVAVLSHALWRRRFAENRGVVGRTILLDGVPFTVVGVMPPDFQFAPFWATRTELWAPLALGGRVWDRGGNSLRVFARLKPGVSLQQARENLRAVTARLESEFPGSNRDVAVTPLLENVTGSVQTPLLVVMGAVALVLLIACANVAHMLLARAAARQKEIAVRSAMGAGGWRLIRQFLVEGFLLAGCGAVAGLLFAAWTVRVLAAIGPASIPRLNTVAIDSSVLLFSVAITLLTGIAFSLAPVLHTRRMQLAAALKQGARAAGGSLRLSQARSLLSASEIALAFMLLIGAGLLLRSFASLRAIDPGFDPSHVLSMVVSVAGSQHAEPGKREMFYRRVVREVANVPGIASASGINHLPLAGDIWTLPFLIEGRPEPGPGESPAAVYRLVMPGYFAAMRLPVLRGRGFQFSDDGRGPGVAIVSERAARLYWPHEEALGKRIRFGAGEWLTIAGVVSNAAQRDWAAAPSPEVYLAALQNEGFLRSPRSPYLTLVARATGDPAASVSAVRNAVWAIDRNLPVSEALTMQDVVETATARPRFEVFLLTLFAAVALLIATAGLHALIVFSVSRRVHEIGIRISLGATGTDVVLTVMRQGLVLALIGSLAGAGGALLLTRLMEGMLFGVHPADPWTYAAVAGVLTISALVAAYIPARRAASIDPIAALRQE